MWVVQHDDQCTTTGNDDRSMAVLPHLAGFYFITVEEVEKRVLPNLVALAQSARMITGCKNATGDEVARVEACCSRYTASSDSTEACQVLSVGSRGVVTRYPIDSWARHCQDRAGGVTDGDLYNNCFNMSSTESAQLLAAEANWNATLNRNYNLLRRVERANEDANPAEALEALCPGDVPPFCHP